LARSNSFSIQEIVEEEIDMSELARREQAQIESMQKSVGFMDFLPDDFKGLVVLLLRVIITHHPSSSKPPEIEEREKEMRNNKLIEIGRELIGIVSTWIKVMQLFSVAHVIAGKFRFIKIQRRRRIQTCCFLFYFFCRSTTSHVGYHLVLDPRTQGTLPSEELPIGDGRLRSQQPQTVI